MTRLSNCVDSQISEGYPWAGNRWKGGSENVLIDLNSTYVVAKFELAKYIVEKVGHSGENS